MKILNISVVQRFMAKLSFKIKLQRNPNKYVIMIIMAIFITISSWGKVTSSITNVEEHIYQFLFH